MATIFTVRSENSCSVCSVKEGMMYVIDGEKPAVERCYKCTLAVTKAMA